MKANKRRRGEFEILGYGKPIRTGVFNQTAACERLAEEILCRRDGRPAADRNVLLGVVIDEFKHVARGGALKHLSAFWNRIPLHDVTRAACWAYADWREEQSDPQNRDGAPKTSTVDNELSNLRNMINRYCSDHAVAPAPTVYMPKAQRGTRGFLRLREVERLLHAADGRIWDAQMNDWRLLASGSYELKDEAWRKSVWPMRRMIRLLIWTGSRANTVRRATWTEHRDRPWIDLRLGNLVRRGVGEARSKKRRPPVRLTPSLLSMVEAWAAHDAALGYDHVIHYENGKALGNDAWSRFALVREAAGLAEDVTLRTLRASTAVWLLEHGCTPEQAAAFLGNTAGVLSRFYDRYAPEFSHAAADALDSRSYAPSNVLRASVDAANDRKRAAPRHDEPIFDAKTRAKDASRS